MTTMSALRVRRPVPHARSTATEQRYYDRYLAARLAYKEDFFDEAARLAGTGPVREVGRGYGAPAVALLRRTPVPVTATAESGSAAARYRQHAATAGCAALLEVRVVPDGLPAPDQAPSTLVITVNALHTWVDPVSVLAGLGALTAPGGTVLATDLRRDADPFITEYVLRELAGDQTEEGRYRARTFVESLTGALTVDELTSGLAAALPAGGPVQWWVEPDGAMAVTIRIRRR